MYYYVGTTNYTNCVQNAIKIMKNKNAIMLFCLDNIKLYEIRENSTFYLCEYNMENEEIEFSLKISTKDAEYGFYITDTMNANIVKISENQIVKIDNCELKMENESRDDKKILGFSSEYGKYSVINVYKGWLHVLPYENENSVNLIDIFTIWLKDKEIIDIVDFSSKTENLIGILLKSKGKLKLKIYELDLLNKKFNPSKSLWKLNIDDENIYKIISFSPAVFLLFSTQSIYLFHTFKNDCKSNIKFINPTQIISNFMNYESSQLFLGTNKHEILQIEIIETQKINMQIFSQSDQFIPYPNCILPINSHMFLVGSICENAKMLEFPLNHKHFNIASEIENLGIIEDFTVNTKNTEILALCNKLTYSEIREIHKNIKLKEICGINLEFVTDLWTIDFVENINILVVSFISETRFFEIMRKENLLEIEEILDENLIKNARTLNISSIGKNIIQITENGIILYEFSKKEKYQIYNKKAEILHCMVNPEFSKFAIHFADKNIVKVYEIIMSEIQQISKFEFDKSTEISSILINDKILIISTFDKKLLFFKINEKCLIYEYKLDKYESVVSMEFLTNLKLVCGTADGKLIIFTFKIIDKTIEICDIDCKNIGIKEIKLNRIQNFYNQKSAIFISTNTNFILYEHLNKIELISIVKNSEFSFYCADLLNFTNLQFFICADFGKISINSYNLPISKSTLLVRIPEIQAKKIILDQALSVIFILGEHQNSQSFLLLYDYLTYELLDCDKLDSENQAFKIIKMSKIIGSNEPLIFICTNNRYESPESNIIPYTVRNKKLHKFAKTIFFDTILSLSEYKKCLVFTRNTEILIYAINYLFSEDGKILNISFNKICSYHSKKANLFNFIEIKENMLICGDISNFIEIYKIQENQIIPYKNILPQPYFANCGIFVDSQNALISAENSIFCISVNQQLVQNIDIKSKITKFINCSSFTNHKLCEAFSKTEENHIFSPTIFATDTGKIGILIQIPYEIYIILSQLEQILVDYFSYKNPAKSSSGFINGALIQKFIECEKPESLKLYDKIKIPKPEITEVFFIINQLNLLTK